MPTKSREKNKIPTVSVIIPAFNRPNLLKRAIKSVLRQTFKNFELIIVDDGSTENIKNVVDNFRKTDKRIRYFWQKNSGGPAGPRNVGIQYSKGKYIAFLDADDEWLPTKLEKQIGLFETSKIPNIGFVSCNSIVIDMRDNTERCSEIPDSKKIFEHLLTWSCVNSCSGIVVKKNVFEDIGGFDDSLKMADDWDLCIRIAKKYKFDFIEEPLFKYHIGQENVNQEWSVERKEKEAERIFDRYRNEYIKLPKVLSLRLMHEGKRWAMSGRTMRGLSCFVKSIRLNPFNFQSYFFFLLSLTGSRFFNIASKLRRKMKGRKLI
jgi:glycosyltransferase involved in cell wall biosynthesis